MDVLDTLDTKTSLKTDNSELYTKDNFAVLHPHSNLMKQGEADPIIIVGGSGSSIVDSEGRSYLDSGAGLGTCSLGVNNERLAKAAYDAIMTQGSYHIFRDISNVSAIKLSQKLLELSPVPMEKVLLQCSGSEANDSAIKLVWYYWTAMGKPEKSRIISRHGSYHGVTALMTAVTGMPALHKGWGLRGLAADHFLKTDATNFYRQGKPGETEEQFSERLAKNLEDLIIKEGPETIGAFLADPHQANSGGVVPPKGYWEKIQAVLRKYDILLIGDEVVSGFGRTGNMWGAQTFGIEPDIITCAKAMSAAMQPISAIMINAKIYNVMKQTANELGGFWHGYTWAGHPVASAVAYEALRIYEDIDILGHIREVSPLLQSEAKALTEHPLIGGYSGVGMFAGLDLTPDKENRTVFGPETNINGRLVAKARSRGLIFRVLGPMRIHVTPPLIATEEEIKEMMRLARLSLDDVYADLKSENLI